MKDLVSRLGLLALIGLGVFVWALVSDRVLRSAPASTPVATSSPALSVSPNSEEPSRTAATSSKPVATSTPVKTPSPVKKENQKAASAPSTTPPAAPASAPNVPSSGNGSLDAAATTLRSALVNILCYVPAGSGLHSISGSGVIIAPTGIILTNAHVAEYFLLSDRGVSCTIRSGSPAVDSYEAAPIFVSPSWLNANADVLTQAAPNGTGEYDFALLAVKDSATSAPLPAQFPFIPLAQMPPSIGTPVVIASYGAQFVDPSQIQSSLFPTIVFGQVKDVFTFVTDTIDVLALGGSAAAQEGSSGGGVADASGNLVGTITTSTVDGSTDTRSLDAITASYIRAEYARETGSSLDILLSESTPAAIADFAPLISGLESVITAHVQ